MGTYSDFFKTLHDETGPVGYLGQGTHYSVLRAVVFHDPMGVPLSHGLFADFAVIWDEDHDTRVMEPVERIYRQGLLSSFLMFGEHKGVFTAILSDSISSVDPFNPALLGRVDELELSLLAANRLKNANIIFLGDLVQMTEGEILRSPNFGRKSHIEIKEVLAQMDLHLGTEVPGWLPDAKNIDDLTRRFEDLTKRKERVASLETKISAICQSLSDPWPSKVVTLGSPGPIISDGDEKVSLYLENLKMLWRLGLQPLKKRKFIAGTTQTQLPAA